MAAARDRIAPHWGGGWYIVGRVGSGTFASAKAAAAHAMGCGEGEVGIAGEPGVPALIASAGQAQAQRAAQNATPEARAANDAALLALANRIPAAAPQAAPQAQRDPVKVTNLIGATVATEGTAKSPYVGRAWAVVSDDEGAGYVVWWEALDGRKVTVGQLADAWRAANLPESWILDGASNVAALGRAMRKLNTEGRIARAMDGREGRWQVSHPVKGSVVGAASHVRDLVVELHGDTLRFDPPTHASRAAVEAAYQAARAGEVSSDMLRAWLDKLIVRRLVGYSCGTGVRFVPAAGRKVWERIQDAIASAVGSDLITRCPVAPSSQVVDRVRDRIAADAEALIAETEAEVAKAPKGEIGTRTARAAIDRLVEVEDRLRGYEVLIGRQPALAARLATLRDSLRRAARDAQGRAYHSDAADRFAGIFDELAREESKAE